ncbi:MULTISPECIES: TetR/AcrR family transcriptional regulator [Bacillaceae]|uniref:TetR family transcriptional regulator n=1 Tax=Domibacillus aminovorans TaxID=29332 RepID=A0A177KSK4_9BACI|nr:MULTISPECIES: TetR/AcrR family transcriptional regulator [Bacillaceae]OAH56322.1 TetR family transcriptional regulator [Domibacillus aminovorans]OAH62867.1 TetR family transcriptional regulator [Domibacillus aminovorans]
MKKNKPKYHQIIDAAVIAIAENGYHQTQVSKIARQAGVADGTIYLYFKNKEDILISLFQEKVGTFAVKMKESIQIKAKAAEQLRMLVENHFTMLTEDPYLAVVTQLELRQSNKELRLKINEVLKEYLLLIDQILQGGIDDGEFRSNLNIRLARQMIFGTLDEMITTWVMNDQKYDLTASASDVVEMLLNGFSAEKRR